MPLHVLSEFLIRINFRFSPLKFALRQSTLQKCAVEESEIGCSVLKLMFQIKSMGIWWCDVCWWGWGYNKNINLTIDIILNERLHTPNNKTIKRKTTPLIGYDDGKYQTYQRLASIAFKIWNDNNFLIDICTQNINENLIEKHK